MRLKLNIFVNIQKKKNITELLTDKFIITLGRREIQILVVEYN